MERPNALTRRDLVRLGVSAAALAPVAAIAPRASAFAAAAAGSADDPFRGLKVGVATYTFSRVPLEKTIRDVKQVGVRYVSIKEAHLPLKSTAEQRKDVVKKFNEAGITPLSCGNIAMKDDESAVRNAFEYARDAGIPTIVCTPVPTILPLLDKLVKEFDIKLAIHNHGPEDKLWPSPYTIWEAVQKYDERIGLCIDVGHTARTGVDPAESIMRCAARLYDVHLKDIATAEVGSKSKPVEVGRGVLDIHKILGNLLAIKFRGLVGLEYEKDMADPLAGVAESIGYVRGVLSDLKTA